VVMRQVSASTSRQWLSLWNRDCSRRPSPVDKAVSSRESQCATAASRSCWVMAVGSPNSRPVAYQQFALPEARQQQDGGQAERADRRHAEEGVLAVAGIKQAGELVDHRL